MHIHSKHIIRFLTFFFIFFIFTSSCSRNVKKIIKPQKIPPVEILYKSAFNDFENGEINSAIDNFKKIETNYSYTEWAKKASLLIIYIYYDASKSEYTLENIKKFEKLYPTDENLPYVKYIKAMTFYEQLNVVSKDQTYTIAALNEFRNIIKDYPLSIYAEDAKLKIDLIYEQMAGKEIYIARYYMQKSKWISAIKRLKIVINEYDASIYSEEALHRLVEIYYRLGNIKEAKKYAAILGYNFNDSDWYKKTYKVVADKNYAYENKKNERKFRDRIIKIFKFSK